jgi:putative ABC transport system ATP-binding protein
MTGSSRRTGAENEGAERMAIIVLKDVHKKYALGKTEVYALRGVSFEVTAGDFISIAGPSGCGKTI